jgi:hypothetical protein
MLMKRIVQGEYHMDIQTHEMPAVNMEEMSVREGSSPRLWA